MDCVFSIWYIGVKYSEVNEIAILFQYFRNFILIALSDNDKSMLKKKKYVSKDSPINHVHQNLFTRKPSNTLYTVKHIIMGVIYTKF